MAKKKDVPDSPRSWAIALSAFVISLLIAGVLRTTGHLFVAIMDTYGASRFQANMPFSVRNVVRNLGGPVAGAIGQRFGARNVTLLGVVLGSLGVLLCSFAPNVLWITLLWGGIHGLGVALGNTVISVVVIQHFVKYRATASGLSAAGSCFGSFFLPALMEHMLFRYGLAGSFLLMGGLMMHALPAALILEEPSWMRRKDDSTSGIPSSKRRKNISEFSAFKESENVLTIDFKNRSCSGDLEKNSYERSKECISNLNPEKNGINNQAFTSSMTSIEDISKNKVEKVKNGEMKSRNLSSKEAETQNSIPEQQTQETSFNKAILSILSNPMFFMISLSLVALAILIDPVFIVIVDFIMDKGFDEEVAKYFISALAFGDLVGKLSFGWITDRGYMTVPRYMMMMHIAQGVCFMLLCLLHEFYILMFMIAAVGMTVGATVVMYPVLVGMYLPSVQSMAMGCVPFFTGIVNVAVPPLIGYFRDEIGSYNGMFYITGSASVIVGFLWILEPLLLKFSHKHERVQNMKPAVSS
ncbi:hypothetical protein NPIL_111241 [Nephila pilipes]|uniref:Major facilitator superfamily (MFS) profile domain-containing protein n=2 Tax=Nephila pilipes TaxID=299642 RepID=A0A8X6U7Z7_NEPPI|nr:hypothetical protein NPIL_111241 [Nephila pilipes]